MGWDPERPTSVVCTECAGAGYVVEHVSATHHRGKRCECCLGSGIVTVARLRAWKLAKAIQP